MNRADKISGGLKDGRVTFERKPQAPLRDPVCNMEVGPETAAATSDHQGVTFYFCSTTCKREFDAHPTRYARVVEPPSATP